MDSVTETSHENWFQREGNAIKSMCCGFLLVFLTSILVFWNETNLVIAQATADVMQGARVLETCLPLGAGAKHEDLVFAACDVNAPEISGQVDSSLQSFMPSVYGASIKWSSEIYQWQETSSQSCTKDSRGGKDCTTTYSYSQGWSDNTVSTNSFRNPHGHQNTGSLPFADSYYDVPAGGVKLSNHAGSVDTFVKTDGYFELDGVLQGQFPSHDVTFQQGNGQSGGKPLYASGRYVTTASGSPQIGDIRISVTYSGSSKASVCAKPSTTVDKVAVLGPSPPEAFDMWGRMTYPLEDLRGGTYDLQGFIAEIKKENAIIAYFLRLVGLILMCLAFNCIYKPLSVSADLLMWLNYCTCCLGSILDKATQAVISAVSCASGCFCFTIVFISAWFFANPTYALLGVMLLFSICGAGAAYRQFGMKKGDVQGREGCVDTPYIKLGKGNHRIIAVV